VECPKIATIIRCGKGKKRKQSRVETTTLKMAKFSALLHADAGKTDLN
jgi:hypothetical protein